MAVDTKHKRQSAIASRRSPWMRRFSLPAPDGSVSQADRQLLLHTYSGILAGLAQWVYVSGVNAYDIIFITLSANSVIPITLESHDIIGITLDSLP